jgi:hypothetical protein
LDRYAILKAGANSKIDIKNMLKDVLPSTIDRKAYVYSTYVNNNKNRTFAYYNSKIIGYNFPKDFLIKNKNKIYSDGSSEIFR